MLINVDEETDLCNFSFTTQGQYLWCKSGRYSLSRVW